MPLSWFPGRLRRRGKAPLLLRRTVVIKSTHSSTWLNAFLDIFLLLSYITTGLPFILPWSHQFLLLRSWVQERSQQLHLITSNNACKRTQPIQDFNFRVLWKRTDLVHSLAFNSSKNLRYKIREKMVPWKFPDLLLNKSKLTEITKLSLTQRFWK